MITSWALLLTVWSLAWILTPGYGAIVDLQANVAALEAKGGKVQLSTCGPKGRLCAKIDVKANKSTGGWSDKRDWFILDGY